MEGITALHVQTVEYTVERVIILLYQVNQKGTIPSLCSTLPECVIQELLRHTSILDREYGANRNCSESGGYALVAETAEDIATVRATIDYENHPCEWAETIGENSEYISALYLLNDDYSILVLVPTSIAPDAILQELED